MSSPQPGPDPASLPPGIPPILGRYRLLRLLGSGGMGHVFEAEHLGINRRCALKILHRGARSPLSLVARFDREIKALGQLRHPNIVAAENAGAADGVVYLVMELLGGCGVSSLLARLGRFHPAEACAIVRAAAGALDYLGHRGLVHRDIKPGNLHLTEAGTVKLVDLGVAQVRGELAALCEPSTVPSPVGTYEYMAPEQAQAAQPVDVRADVYALGCTLYRLLTGQLPFPWARTVPEKIYAHRAMPFPDLAWTALPESGRVLLQRMTAKRPEDRPWPAEIVAGLAECAAPARLTILLPAARTDSEAPTPVRLADATPAAPAPAPALTRRRWLVGAGGALALAAGVWGAGNWWSPDRVANLDGLAPDARVELLRRRPVPVVWSARAGATWHHHSGRQELVLTTPQPALFLFATASWDRYQIDLGLAGLAAAGGRLILGYRPVREPDCVARFVYVGAVSAGRFGVGAGVVRQTDMGLTLAEDGAPWAAVPWPDVAGHAILQVGVRRMGADRRDIHSVRLGGPLPRLEEPLANRLLPAGGVGIALHAGQLTVDRPVWVCQS